MMHFQTSVSSMLDKESKLESDDCINEKLMNTNVTNLIEDDNNDLNQEKFNKIETPTISNETVEEKIPNDLEFFSKNLINVTDFNREQHNNLISGQNSQKLENPNQTSLKIQIVKPSMKFYNPGNDLNKNSIFGNYPLKFNQNNIKAHNNNNNSNSNNSKYIYSNNRIANIQQNKALNLHKLWPHSLKQQSSSTSQVKSDDKITFIKQGETSDNVTENKKNEEESVTDPVDNKKHESKTPLCIINELVRYNKIKHEYVLLDEIGPAHKKTFFILLKLGIDSDKEETYKACGSSIKKTQHIAAELALKSTKFQMPVKRDRTLNHPLQSNVPDKLNNNEPNELKAKKRNINNTANPPTVKLNTLAMKLGLVANYTHHISNYQNKNDYTNFGSIATNSFNTFQSQRLDYSSNYTNFKYPVNNMFPGNIPNPDYSNTYNKGRVNNNFDNPRNFYNVMRHQNQAMYNQPSTFKQSYFPAQQMQQSKQIINVKLTFANKEFEGKGIALQHAKHDAAEKALEYFTDPEHFLEAKSISNSSQNNNVKAYRPPQFYEQQKSADLPENNENKNVDANSSGITDIDKNSNNENNFNLKSEKSEVKSEVQLVHEYAFFLKKNIEFTIVQESGASHLKKFVTKCSITNRIPIQKSTSEVLSPENPQPTATADETENSTLTLETTGEGNSKRLSKKIAASKMLDILKEKFEPLFLISSKNEEKKSKSTHISSGTKELENPLDTKEETKAIKKKNRKSKAKNIIKIKKTSPEYGKGTINAISRLMQIQQAKKERDPTFEFIERTSEKTKKREFLVACNIEPSTEGTETFKTEGKGITKKAAKQKAAEEMLIKLGYQIINPILKPSLKSSVDSSTLEKNDIKCSSSLEKLNEKKVKFSDVVIDSDTLTVSSNTGKHEVTQKKATHNKAQKPINELQRAQQNKQQKLRNIQQAIANNQLNNTNHNLDSKTFNIVFKIAQELLESVQKPNEDSNSNETVKEFCSASADSYLKEHGKNGNCNTKEETLEEKTQFNLLNGGTQTVNYKKMLDYLADTIGFKVNCQSLQCRDSTVNSYVNLSIFPETEKPLNGNGSTYIESSNSACLNALQYLSSKYVIPSSLNNPATEQQPEILETRSDDKSE